MGTLHFNFFGSVISYFTLLQFFFIYSFYLTFLVNLFILILYLFFCDINNDSFKYKYVPNFLNVYFIFLKIFFFILEMCFLIYCKDKHNNFYPLFLIIQSLNIFFGYCVASVFLFFLQILNNYLELSVKKRIFFIFVFLIFYIFLRFFSYHFIY